MNNGTHSNDGGKTPGANPFSSPMAEAPSKISKASTAKPGQLNNILSIAKKTFLHWEKWRLFYLFVCGAYTLACATYFDLDYGEVTNFITILFCGVFANVCFFAAPVIHTYLTWLGLQKSLLKIIEITIIVLGTTITCAGATFVIMDLAR